MSSPDAEESRALRPNQAQSTQFSLASLLLIVVLISVCMGVWTISPGFGIFVSVAAIPALIRTVMLSDRRDELGIPFDARQKAGRFITSLVISIFSCVLLAVVGISTFLLTCATLLGSINALSGQTGSRMDIVWFEMAVGAGLAIGMMFVVIAFARYRWNRDTLDVKHKQSRRS